VTRIMSLLSLTSDEGSTENVSLLEQKAARDSPLIQSSKSNGQSKPSSYHKEAVIRRAKRGGGLTGTGIIQTAGTTRRGRVLLLMVLAIKCSKKYGPSC